MPITTTIGKVLVKVLLPYIAAIGLHVTEGARMEGTSMPARRIGRIWSERRNVMVELISLVPFAPRPTSGMRTSVELARRSACMALWVF